MKEDFDKIYDPKIVEDKIYRLWEKSGYFNPDKLPFRHKKPFTIIMPPPNANGLLHMGHALFVTLEDLMIRYKRMRGYKTLWLPGADHAGFETQVVFDKKLEKESRNRFEIPRDELYKEIWEFTQANKINMENQLKKLGASCDWSREKFTLDPNIIEIVYDTFRKLYEDGLAYRSERVINWCPKHQTALSELETKYVEREDSLYYIKYGPLTLATVRPETKFGDTALAVNPKDKRYQKYVGKEIEAQGILGKLKFKVIADEVVDPKFGTGVVKVTPAHDVADFEIWQRHKDEIPGPKSIINERGRLTGETGEFAGMKVVEAREKVAEKMKEIKILEKTEPYKHSVATCYKCGNTLEPLLKPQWFIKMTEKPKAKGDSLRDGAVKAIKDKKIKIIPQRYEKVFLHWMKNLRDWNISRQITWGIRIPAWYKTQVGTEFEAVHFHLDSFCKKINIKPEKLSSELYKIKVRWMGPDKKGIIQFDLESIQKLKNKDWIDEAWIINNKIERSQRPGEIFIGERSPEPYGWVQDPDVFDTWFSSGQWPYATLGYPKNKDFKTFYPTDVMETGWDILFFWVARMIMLGIYRTGKIPFYTVYLHGLVRDKDRVKMSKSKGNVIDPLGVAHIYGSDAIRMALIMDITPGNDPVISENKIRGYRNFATKIWNVSRFIMMNYDPKFEKIKPKLLDQDRKCLNELKTVHKKITKDMDVFKFHNAAYTIYHYFWHTFADKIIEASKPRLHSENMSERAAAFKVNLEILVTSLKLLHPFMPFITEEIYQKLPILRRGSGQVKDKPRRKVGAPTRASEKLLMVEKW